MKRFLRALPLLGALLAACSSPAPVEEAKKVDDVDAIVDSNLAARGGKEKLQALRSIRQTGRITASDGRVAKVVQEVKKPGLFRLQFTYQGTTSIFAHDGKTGWQVAPLQGQFEPELSPPDAETSAVEQRDVEGPLVGWREKGHVVELVGREPLAGGEAFKLKITLKGGGTRYDYVDVASRQVVRSDIERMVQGRPLVLENFYSDFRDEGGIVFPHLFETHAKDRPQTLKIVVNKIELDPELDDARFQKPQ